MFQGKPFQILPELRLFWQHEFLQNPTNFSSQLDGGKGAAFDTSTVSPNRDSVFAGAGVSVRVGDRWNANVFYNANFGQQDNISHMISIGAGLRF
jgi:outer membrane autotransporter protein